MLFRNENPILGDGTLVQELSGAAAYPAAGNPLFNTYKPITREIVSIPMSIVTDPTADIVGPLFINPWYHATLVKASFMCVTASSASVTLSLYNVPYASQPEAATSGNLLATALNVDSGVSANTQIQFTLTTTTAYLTLGSGDVVSYSFSAAPTAMSGALLQLEFIRA